MPTRIPVNGGRGAWIEVERTEEPSVVYASPHPTYTIVNDNLRGPDTALGLYQWGDSSEVENRNSDVFGSSEHLDWQDIQITPRWIRAPSIKRLREAVKHVTFTVRLKKLIYMVTFDVDHYCPLRANLKNKNLRGYRATDRFGDAVRKLARRERLLDFEVGTCASWDAQHQAHMSVYVECPSKFAEEIQALPGVVAICDKSAAK
jgi:hypothetical protein